MLPPNRLGLFDMLLTYARAFTITAATIEFCRGQVIALVVNGGSPQATVDPSATLTQETKLALLKVKELCESVAGLEPVADQIDRVLARVEAGPYAIQLATDLEHIQLRIMDELKQHYYFPVTAANAQIYESEQPFGLVVKEAFPSAQEDIRDATRCHVLGQPTACAFHLMRSMEVALRCFAKKLKVEYKPSWDAYCSAIDAALKKPHQDKNASERKQEPHYREILGDLMAVKLAWRNPTMHVERRYEPHEALQVYMATGILLDRLASAGIRERRAASVPAILPNPLEPTPEGFGA